MVSWLPSGKLTVCELENGPVEIGSFPIKNGDFPWLCNSLPEGNPPFVKNPVGSDPQHMMSPGAAKYFWGP